MDELAVALKMDPIELRRVNDTQTEPIKGLPYTSRALMTCFDQAADAFGWQARNPTPGSKREGDWLIGWGCAASAYPTQMAAATARVRVFAEGRALVETAGHEIGNGLYTVVAQTAAERLGIPVEKVSVSSAIRICRPRRWPAARSRPPAFALSSPRPATPSAYVSAKTESQPATSPRP